MPEISLTEISKKFHINRTTIYRAVKGGKLSRLSNGMFDLAEVIRVFGEVPSSNVPLPVLQSNDQSKLIEVLERELLFLKNQIEQKDKQINSLQLLLETPMQRHNATEHIDTLQRDEVLIKQGIYCYETSQATSNNVTMQHDATSQNVTLKHHFLDVLEKKIRKFRNGF